MKNIFCFFIIYLFSFHAFAQEIENAGDYMTAFSNAQVEMDQKYMTYVSAAAHSSRVRKIDRLRTQALESIDKAKYKTMALPQYQGDNSLRQASIDYVLFCYRIFNEDYSKIVNMEEIAEQSVDKMQAYLLLQERTSEKLHEASENLSNAEKAFAKKYSVNLVDSKSELSDKMGLSGKVNRYSDRVCIIFFKCNYEDGELFRALNSAKLTDAEQARNGLMSYASEGLQALKTDSLAGFQGNPRLAISCRQSLEFYNNMAKTDIPKLTDFYLKQENFNKMKAAMEAKGSKRTKEDVEQYNNAVQDLNRSVSGFNELNDELNHRRAEVVQDWEREEKTFRDELIPYYK